MIPLLAGFALLVILLVGGGALSRAPVAAIRRGLTLMLRGLAIGLGALLLILTGRVGLALAALRLLTGFGGPGAGDPGMGASGMGARAGRSSGFRPPPRGTTRMSRQEAQAVLGVGEGASEAEINEAWKRLMMKVHPDHGGTDALAARVNEARTVLSD